MCADRRDACDRVRVHDHQRCVTKRRSQERKMGGMVWRSVVWKNIQVMDPLRVGIRGQRDMVVVVLVGHLGPQLMDV